MKHENGGDEKRGPGNIEQSDQNGRGPKPLNGFQIALGGQSGGFTGLQGQTAHGGGEDPAIQAILQMGPDARHDPGAGMVQNTHRQKQCCCQQ